MNAELTQRLEKIGNAVTAFLNAPISGERISDKKEGLEPHTLLLDLCRPILAEGGKRWRPLLMVLCYEYAGGRDDCIYQLAPLIEGIHCASLIHDDIEDGSDFRRGKPAAHIVHGLDSALNAGSWLYFQALRSIEDCTFSAEIKLDLYNAALSHIRSIHEGQALDIQWHRNAGFFPRQDNYKQMIRLKTGALAVLAAYTGMRAAGKSKEDSEAFAALFTDAGISFQIADDVKNITTGNAGKKRGDDITEGKKSLPVIIHVEKHPEDADSLTRYFVQAQKEGIESPAVEQTIQMLHRSGAVTEAAQQGHAATAVFFEQLTAYCGSTAADVFKQLFSTI